MSRMPFMDTAELAMITGEAHVAIHRSLTGLLDDGIAGRVSHGTAHLPTTRCCPGITWPTGWASPREGSARCCMDWSRPGVWWRARRWAARLGITVAVLVVLLAVAVLVVWLLMT